MPPAPDYLDPNVPRGVRRVVMPVVDATEEALRGYGRLVDDPKDCKVAIVGWPARGWRPVDEDSGDEGGTTEGVFVSEWKGDVLYGRNEAVDGHYILGYGCEPADAVESHARAPSRVLLWHCNYHPDGGQLFWPLDGQPFLVPAALPGDDLRPESFVAFRSDGSFGIYIHPSIWHEGPFPIGPTGRFFDKQGKVHGRVSCDLANELGVLLNVPLA